MNAIEEIRTKLQKYPDAKFEAGTNHICVFPASENGFKVELITGKNNYTVHFNGWHEEFGDVKEALGCFAWGLSTECRLKEHRRGGVAYKWSAEYKDGDKWVEESTTGMFLYPYWNKAEIRYLQNNLIGEGK
jgi:hypothetical protein